MLAELEAIAEAHESPPTDSVPTNSKIRKNEVIAILNIDTKGKSIPLKIRRYCDPQTLAEDTIHKYKLPRKSYQQLLVRIRSLWEEGKKKLQMSENSDEGSSISNTDHSEISGPDSYRTGDETKTEDLSRHDMDSQSVSDSQMFNEQEILATIGVSISENEQKDLTIRAGDTPEALAAAFVRKHKLEASSYYPFASKLKKIMDGLKEDITPEKPNELIPQESKRSSPTSASSNYLLSLKVRISESQFADVVFRADDNAHDVATAFVSHHNLSPASVFPLTAKIQEMIDASCVREASTQEPINDVNRVNSVNAESDDQSVAPETEDDTESFYATRKLDAEVDSTPMHDGTYPPVESWTRGRSPRGYSRRSEEAYNAARQEWSTVVSAMSSPQSQKSTRSLSSPRPRSAIRNSLTVASTTEKQRPRSASPVLHRQHIFERLYRDASANLNRRQLFLERLEEQKKLEQERQRRLIRARSKVTRMSHKCLPPGTNIGEDLYRRDILWLEAKRRNCDRLREDIAERQKEETPTFQPQLVTRDFNAKCETIRYYKGKPQTVFNALHSSAFAEEERRRIALHAQEEDFKRNAFHPKISDKSSKLAEKRRKKRFYGVASTVTGTVTPANMSPPSTPQEFRSTLPSGSDRDQVDESLGHQSNGSSDERNVRKNIYDLLYEERNYIPSPRRRSASASLTRSSFVPDIGPAKFRPVEKTKEEFTQRLYDYRLRQKEIQEEIFEKEQLRLLGRDPEHDKKLTQRDIENLVDRMRKGEERKKERQEMRVHDEKKNIEEQKHMKCDNIVSNKIAARKRRAALEEIFMVLIMSAEMSKDRKNNSPGNGNVGDARDEWRMSREAGEDSYELCPAHQEDQPPDTNSCTGSFPNDCSPIPVSVENATTPKKTELSEQACPESDSADGSKNEYFFRAETLARHEPTLSENGSMLHPDLSVDDSFVDGNGVLKPSETINLDDIKKLPTPSSKSHIRFTQPILLDTLHAQPSLLKPKALSKAATMVIESTQSAFLSLEEFIECFEVLMESGLTPPLNMILTAPDRSSKPQQLTSLDKEVVTECRGVPTLHQDKRSVKLRSRSASATARHERLYNDRNIRETRQKDLQRKFESDKLRDATFKPVIYSKKTSDRLMSKMTRDAARRIQERETMCKIALEHSKAVGRVKCEFV